MPYLGLARQALNGVDDWAITQEKSQDGTAVWKAIYQRLHSGVFTIELVWLVRELVKAKLWTADGLRDVAFVPTQETLDIGFRLGLLSSPYVGDFSSTLYASRILTAFCGEEYGLEAGLAYFGHTIKGCDYHCSTQRSCDYFCRERLRR